MLVDTDIHESPAEVRAIVSASLPKAPPIVAVANGERGPRQGRSPLRARRLAPLLLMASGLALVAVAAPMSRLASVSGAAATAASRVAPASGVAIGGPNDVASQIASYAPGQSSGWHTHTGMHAVVVLSGTLTIVDGECQRTAYRTGESYVGGREVHVALNETAAPLEMAVTYMFPAGVSHTSFHVSASEPPGCDAR